MQFSLTTVRAVRISIALLLISAVALWSRVRVRVSEERMLEDIRYLSSAPLGGRGAGSAGLKKAADYIRSEFARAGVRPPGAFGSDYLQNFPVTLNAKNGGKASFRWRLGNEWHILASGVDFEAYPFSSSQPVTAPVVFAGYGITACEYGYDDYAGVDAANKIVVILRHEPQEYDASSVFEGRVYTEHSQIFRKLLNAKAHGVAGVLLVSDMANHSGPDSLDRLTALPSPGGAGIPFAGVRSSVVESWFSGAGRDFIEAQNRIDRNLQPESFVLPGVTVELATDVSAESRTAANVVGYIPGTSAEYVVAGAHYDHLGNGEQFSLSPDRAGALHPGADDNASGTAAVLALARQFGRQAPFKRGLLLVAFAGEEIGLLGSTWFTTYPPLPLEDAVAMLNMDMIGRMRERTLIVGGADSGSGLRRHVEMAGKHFPFEIQMSGQAVYGSSDHTAFTSHQVPTLFFFTGLHADYHRPSDTADKIDARSTALVADLVAEIVTALAESPQRPVFRRAGGSRNCETQKFTHTAANGGR